MGCGVSKDSIAQPCKKKHTNCNKLESRTVTKSASTLPPQQTTAAEIHVHDSSPPHSELCVPKISASDQHTQPCSESQVQVPPELSVAFGSPVDNVKQHCHIGEQVEHSDTGADVRQISHVNTDSHFHEQENFVSQLEQENGYRADFADSLPKAGKQLPQKAAAALEGIVQTADGKLSMEDIISSIAIKEVLILERAKDLAPEFQDSEREDTDRQATSRRTSIDSEHMNSILGWNNPSSLTRSPPSYLKEVLDEFEEKVNSQRQCKDWRSTLDESDTDSGNLSSDDDDDDYRDSLQEYRKDKIEEDEYKSPSHKATIAGIMATAPVKCST
eukprot:Gb_06282 [translate_table: standard]